VRKPTEPRNSSSGQQVDGQGLVEDERLRRHADPPRQLRELRPGAGQLVELGLPGERGLLRVAEDRQDPRDHLDPLRVAAVRGRPRADVRPERHGVGQDVLGGEDDVGEAPGEVAPGLRRAGLEERRATLRRARDGQRPAHGEVLPDVVDRPHPRGVREDPGGPVADQGALAPGVPELEHDLDELRRPRVAVGAVRQPAGAEVLGHGGHEGRHGVPARAAGAQVVERREPPGEVERLVERRRRGADEAHALGHRGHGREHDRGVHRAERRPVRALLGVRQRVGEEDGVQPPPLGGARDLGVEAGRDVVRRRAPARPPRGLVHAQAHDGRQQEQRRLPVAAGPAHGRAGAAVAPTGSRSPRDSRIGRTASTKNARSGS
jgi:hypothetical protein